MKRTKKLKVVMGVLFALSSSKAFLQGYIEGGFIPNRDFLDDEKNKLGSSNEWQIAGKYTMPFSVKKDDMGQPIIWAGTVRDNMLNRTIMKELVR